MPTLAQLRRELQPVYKHYTDAVISMIGLSDQKAIKEAKKGNLLEAHKVQQVGNIAAPSSLQGAGFSVSTTPANIPSWFQKPLPKVPSRKIELTIAAFSTQEK